jgi:hypothetical protein
MKKTVGLLLLYGSSVALGSDLATEPILYSNHRGVVYKVFTRERLLPLHAELSKAFQTRFQFRVIPYFGAKMTFAGENLEIYYQEKAGGLDAIRDNLHRMGGLAWKRFAKDLTKDYRIDFLVRLPEGKRIIDVRPEAEGCRDKNTMYQGFSLGGLTKPGAAKEDLLYFYCDGAKALDANFVEQGLPLTPEGWRTAVGANAP